MSKFFKKALSVLVIFCCLTGSVIEVSASGTTPHIKFTNESTDTTDLRVAKAVTGTGYPEHVKFRFKLKLDLNGDKVAETVSDLKYTVTDRNGQIVRKSGGRVVEFKTDGNGVFELEAGQTATFSKVGSVAYEVTEESDYRRPKMIQTGEGDEAISAPEVDSSGPIYYQRTVKKEDGKDVITDTELHPEYKYELRAMAKDGYTLTSPTGGKSGNVTAGMETIVFTNKYADPGAASTVLRVRKTVSYPEGYPLPDAIKEAKFWFRLDTADIQVREYTVEDPVKEDDTIRLTDENGYFYLYAGETAAFADMKANDAWRVEEIVKVTEGGDSTKVCPAAWWPTGKTMQQGSTVPAEPVIFNNSNTALRVSKTVDEEFTPDAPDPEFTFQLLDARGNPMAGKTYYRYKILSDTLVLNGTSQTWTTDNQGYFCLKRNEEAVFCGFTAGMDGTAGDGIRPNTTVTVKEIGRLIVDEEGKTKVDTSYAEQPSQTRDVLDTGAVVSMDFVNTRVDVTGTLTVTKYVENATEEGSGADNDFHFILSKKQVADGVETYVPVDGAVFEFGPEDEKQNLATGAKDQGWESGEFTIKAGQTAKFSRLPVDAEYKVEEVKLTSEYKPKGIEPGPDGSYQYAQTGTLTEKDSLEFTFINEYKPKKVDIKINKVDDQGDALPGADFMLYLVEGKGNGTGDMVLPDGENEDYRYTTETTEGAASVTIEDLKPDTYWLYEEKAPSGYRLLQSPLEIQIEQTEDGLKVTIDGIVYSVGDTPVEKNDKLTNVKVTAGSTGADGEDTNGVVELTIPNLYFYELPNSGGIGIYWYSIGGILLMMAAALILYRKTIRGRGC